MRKEVLCITRADKTPVLSIICLVYNHESYLHQAIDSLIMQKMDFPFEILLGEDCSTDNSRTIIKEYENSNPGYFDIYYRKVNMGATGNGYDLMMRAKGKYISFFETDDYYLDPLALQMQVDFLENHPEFIGVTHNYKMVDENGDAYKVNFVKKTFLDKPVTLKDFLENGFITRLSCGIYRNFILDNGDYIIIKTAHHLVGDLTILSILLSRGDIFLLSKEISAYRRVEKIGGSSAASLGITNRAQSLFDHTCILDKVEAYFNGKVRYDNMRLNDITHYISKLLHHADGFKYKQLSRMLKQASNHVRWRACVFVISYPYRKLRWHMKKLQE